MITSFISANVFAVTGRNSCDGNKTVIGFGRKEKKTMEQKKLRNVYLS